ncbi:MAG: hypothetical protein HKN50_05045 [Gammaproteobacteria bacterium]|nr:hypothetical protein [Gammaproteobacteria bacterium]
MKVSASIEIAAPKEDVWAAITDIHNCADMVSEIIKINVLEAPAAGVVGLKWEETRMMFGKEATETMWITEAANNEYYQTRAENNGTVYASRMAVTGEGDSCTLTMSFRDEPVSTFAKMMSGVMGLFGKGWMKKMLQKDIEDIKQFVEAKRATAA